MTALPGPEPKRVSRLAAASYLHDVYGWPLDRCERILATATQIRPAPNAEPTGHGFVEVVRDGSAYIFTDRGRRHRT
jgi:hypothetical protein